VSELVDFILHIDRHLEEFLVTYGEWVYGLLFAVVFAETGLVVTPFLPGDSLLFAAGAMAGTGLLDPFFTAGLLFVAAVAGDAVNYAIGRRAGPRVFRATDTTSLLHRLLNRQHLAKAHAFFERYGGKAIVLGRFVPIVRTFVPFVAGAAEMSRPAFVFYNFTGAAVWVAVCYGGGLLFGNIPIVREHFSLVALGIIFVSILPMLVEFVRHWRARGRASVNSAAAPPPDVPRRFD
jgi:membrane-associated protein